METDVLVGLGRLAARLRGPHACLVDARRLSGGASLETWAFDIDAAGEPDRLILRRRAFPKVDPTGFQSVNLAGEAALLRAAAAAGAPVPPLIHLCDEADGLGEAHVTSRIDGETLGRRIVTDPAYESVRPGLARQCGEIMARIHGAPPPPGIGLAVEDAPVVLDRYERLYRAIGPERPILELAFRHLRVNAPDPVAPVLVHGDFRNGNLIIDPGVGVAAVLDWEMAHLGDPAEDLGWICVNSWRFGRPDRPVGGFGDYAELMAGYEQGGGPAIPLGRVRYWQAMGSLMWAVICMRMYDSWASGLTNSVERPMIGRRVSEAEIDLINLFEAGL